MAIAADNSSDLSSTGSSYPAAAAGIRRSTRPPRKFSARPPTATPPTWSAPSGAARRAFDTTDWSTDTELRVRCIRQLRDAMKANIEELRELTIAEVGAPGC